MASPNPLREAIRRTTQAVMLLVPVPILVSKLWGVLVFPRDEHSWLLISALPVVASVPIAIWWREATGSRVSIKFEIIVSSVAAVVGFALFVLFAAWTGFLLTGPYTGPMSAEATFFLLIFCGIAGAGSVFLLLSPLVLDAAFFTSAFRKRAWKTVAVALPVVAVIALQVGPHLKALFW